jgi:hypothetical protein
MATHTHTLAGLFSLSLASQLPVQTCGSKFKQVIKTLGTDTAL